MHISIEKGKTLIIRLMAVGPVVEGRAQRDVWFEVNGEVSHKLENDCWTRLKVRHGRCVPFLSRTRIPRWKRSRAKKRRTTRALLAHRCLASWWRSA